MFVVSYQPLMSDIEDCRVELDKAKKQVADLLQQRHASEVAFGQQRAKFMELFRNKEGNISCRYHIIVIISVFSLRFAI